MPGPISGSLEDIDPELISTELLCQLLAPMLLNGVNM